jgi:hypothetical protein
VQVTCPRTGRKKKVERTRECSLMVFRTIADVT